MIASAAAKGMSLLPGGGASGSVEADAASLIAHNVERNSSAATTVYAGPHSRALAVMGRIAGSATGSALSTSQSVLTGSLTRAFIMGGILIPAFSTSAATPTTSGSRSNVMR